MFNENFKKIRLNRNLSQKQVADYLNVSPQSVSKWEKGEALPSIEYLPKFATLFNCDINDFFSLNEHNVYDIVLLKDFFSFMESYLCSETKLSDAFTSFLNQYLNIYDIINGLFDDLKQYQTIRNKNLQGCLKCSESDAKVLLDYFIKLELVEKNETDDNYFVIKRNMEDLKVLLKVLIELSRCKSKSGII